jgi:1,4-alpha-glucan branching enzyme
VIQIAEYWPPDPYVVRPTAEGGADFDALWHDGLRDAIRGAVAQAAASPSAPIDLDAIARNLQPAGLPAAWKAVQYVESHDEVYKDRGARIARLAGGGDARSWYARSRARVATALLLTAPGIPALFMGQEILEDRPWHDDVANWSQFLIDWSRAESEAAQRDFLRFTQDLVRLRRRLPALCGEGIRVPQVHERDRVLVMHRWVEGAGHDVVVIASFNEATLDGYGVELPHSGPWNEVFNSDLYDHFPNPWVTGNGGRIDASGGAGRVYPATARVRIPANAVLVLARG